MIVFALMELQLLMVFVDQLDVQVDRHGMEYHAFVIQDIIGMVLTVFYVSMDKSGITMLNLVYVRLIIYGMGIFVKGHQIALEIEHTIVIIKFVYVRMIFIGMEILASKKHLVVADKLGMILLSNVIVQHLSIGMVTVVFIVLMEKFGTRT